MSMSGAPPEGRQILYWDAELGARPQDHVRPDIPQQDRAELARILAAGAESHPDMKAMGWADCRICGARLGTLDLHGHGFEWPEKAEHYLLEHGIWTPGCASLLRAVHGGERGVTAPLDPARNPVIAWGAEAGFDAARDAAVGWALRPVTPALTAIDMAQRAHAGARGVYRAGQVAGGREGPSMAQVGGEWWHGTGDRMRAIAQIASDIRALVADITEQLGMRRAAVADHPSDAAVAAFDADAQWIAADVQPFVESWSKFAASERDSIWTLIATTWERYEAWSDRVRRLRELARARGFMLTSPEPADLPKTIWERGAEGEGGPAAWLGVVKVSLAAVLGISGFLGLYAVVRELSRRAPTSTT